MSSLASDSSGPQYQDDSTLVFIMVPPISGNTRLGLQAGVGEYVVWGLGFKDDRQNGLGFI